MSYINNVMPWPRGSKTVSLQYAASPSSYPDRAALLAEREVWLRKLVNEDVSSVRALAFVVCVAAMCVSAYSAPRFVASGDGGSVTFAVALLVVVCGGGCVVLHRMRVQNQRRWEAIQGWVMLAHAEEARALPAGDLSPEIALAYDVRVGNVPRGFAGGTGFPTQYGWGSNFSARAIVGSVLLLFGAIVFLLGLIGSIVDVSAGSVGAVGAGLIGTLAMRAVVRRVPKHASWCLEQYRAVVDSGTDGPVRT